MNVCRSISVVVRRVSPFFLLAFLLLSCTTDSYDQGDGRYSQLTADFGELAVNSRKQGVSFVTDEGVRYILQQSVTASWIKTADSVYRATIYYNKVEEQTVEVVRLISMPTLIPRDARLYKRQPQDPLGVESCWVTASGKYLNMGLLMKNGRNDDGSEGIHALSLVCDEVRLNDDQTRTAYYRLLHEQGEAPEYYTNRRYVSVLLPDKDRPDSVHLTIKTYDGLVEKKFKI
jgi:hypothetical protein